MILLSSFALLCRLYCTYLYQLQLVYMSGELQGHTQCENKPTSESIQRHLQYSVSTDAQIRQHLDGGLSQ